MNRTKSDPPLTLHDLLQLHLQGLDGAGWVVSSPPFYPMDGQPAFHYGSNIVVFQEDHPVCVLDHCAAGTKATDQKLYLFDFETNISWVECFMVA